MEVFDHWRTEQIGQGAVFQASTRRATYDSISRTTGDRFGVKHRIVLKSSPVDVFDEDGKPFQSTQAKNAALGLLRELRVLTSKELQNHPNIVKLLSIAWNYTSCVSQARPAYLMRD